VVDVEGDGDADVEGEELAAVLVGGVEEQPVISMTDASIAVTVFAWRITTGCTRYRNSHTRSE
jgi:hypothetical protein